MAAYKNDIVTSADIDSLTTKLSDFASPLSEAERKALAGVLELAGKMYEGMPPARKRTLTLTRETVRNSISGSACWSSRDTACGPASAPCWAKMSWSIRRIPDSHCDGAGASSPGSRQRVPARALAREPRVVIDGASAWPALDRWQPGYLKAAVGPRSVAVREKRGPPCNMYQDLGAGGKIDFAEYVDWVSEIAEGEDFRYFIRRYTTAADMTRAVSRAGFEFSYYLDAKLAELSRVLLDDVRTPGWYAAKPIDIIFWLGVLGTSSGLHADIAPNCNVQVVGSKHFVLFSPSQSRLLYQVRGTTHCAFDPNAPDFERFPRARDAVGYQCTLRAGECLYIPVGWFHQVTVMSAWAANVNFFWARPFPQGLRGHRGVALRGRARTSRTR